MGNTGTPKKRTSRASQEIIQMEQLDPEIYDGISVLDLSMRV